AEHAAHAATGQLDLPRGTAEQRTIDPDLAELVDHDTELVGLAPSGAAREQPVDERGLAAAEESGHDDKRHAHAASLPPHHAVGFSTTTTLRLPAAVSG